MNFKLWINENQIALHQKEDSFLGWTDFMQALNKFVNNNVLKINNGLEYVHVQNGSIKDNSANIVVHMGQGVPTQLLGAVKMYVEKMGMKIIGQERHDDEVLLKLAFIASGRQARGDGWMGNALRSGAAIDIRQIGKEISRGIFKLSRFIPNAEYVDGETQEFIHSIGKDLSTGDILASYDTRFQNNPRYETLWVR